MELKRRNFIAVGLAALAAAGTGAWVWLRQRPPVRWLVAVRVGHYSGPIRPLDECEMKQPGKWIG
ncbi:MAG: hypothetical protein EPN23_09985 [Verrucomicrobia bacterium]|nr:MAG: hypothetical protein EPN23_09985 [Verrucomicrobiota bacterium]